MSAPLVMRIMALSINTVKRAGMIIRDIMQKGNLGIVEKEGKDDLQTEADRSAQRCIIASLNKKFPNITIIGEEGCSDLNVSAEWLVTEEDKEFLSKTCPAEWGQTNPEDIVVWVDPLDGTAEFTQGLLHHVTVLVGIAVKDRAVGGVIYQPYFENANGELGRTIWGLKGLGTGGFQYIKAPADKFIITTTRSHMNPTVQSALDALTPTDVVRVGGAGFKVLQLLEGKAHAYVFASPGCKKWDTCAPEAVLEAQGGILTDMKGEHYSYGACVQHRNCGGVLATIEGISHEDIIRKLPPNIMESIRS